MPSGERHPGTEHLFLRSPAVEAGDKSHPAGLSFSTVATAGFLTKSGNEERSGKRKFSLTTFRRKNQYCATGARLHYVCVAHSVHAHDARAQIMCVCVGARARVSRRCVLQHGLISNENGLFWCCAGLVATTIAVVVKWWLGRTASKKEDDDEHKPSSGSHQRGGK